MINLKIAKLLSEAQGVSQQYEVEVPAFEDKEFHIYPGQKLTFEAYRIEDGLSIHPLNTTIVGKAQCVVTLKDFDLEVETINLDKQFYVKMPEFIEDEDAELIDTRTLEIDIEELLREAIFLGLPTAIKSPEALNSKPLEAGDKFEEQPTQSPFSNLKDLLE